MKCVKIVPMVALLSLMFVAGCVVQSLYPFYTDKTKIATPPDILGHWEPIKGEEEGGKPWLFSEGAITSYHKGVELTQLAVFFKVDDVLFVDVSAQEPLFNALEESMWKNAHLLSVHQVYKVVTNRNEMTLYPLDLEWVEKQLESGAVKLSYHKPAASEFKKAFEEARDDKGEKVFGENMDDGPNPAPIVLTEKSEKLTEFLKYCIANPAAFDGEDMRYVFRKVPDQEKKLDTKN